MFYKITTINGVKVRHFFSSSACSSDIPYAIKQSLTDGGAYYLCSENCGDNIFYADTTAIGS